MTDDDMTTLVATPAWPARFEEVLRANLPEVSPESPITPEFSLPAHGLNSLGTVSLLLALEEEYSVSLPDELLNMDTFATAGRLWAVFEQLGAAGA